MTRMDSMKNLNTQGFQSFGGGACLSSNQFRCAFTLAEMMVVLLIMSIVLACLAPAMTTKMKADQSIQTSPWKWAQNNTDAYFSVNSNQSAMIGQSEKDVGEDAKLIISDSSAEGSAMDILLYKYRNSPVARLRWFQGGLLFGLSNQLAPDSVSVGINTRSSQASVAIGNNAQANGQFSTAVGPSANASTSGTAIGNQTFAGDNSIAIGSSVNAFDRSVVIGNDINGNSENIVVIGNNAIATDIGGTAVGDGAEASYFAVSLGSSTSAHGRGSIAIGPQAMSTKDYSIAIGALSSALYENSIAIGNNSNANTSDSIAIGASALKVNSSGYKNIAIGTNSMIKNTTGYANVGLGTDTMENNTTGGTNTAIGHHSMESNTTGSQNTALGYYSLQGNQTGSYNTAIGREACRYVKGSNKTCIGANSGPRDGHIYSKNTDNEERIFIGSQSKFNGGAAVLEVHNLGTKRTGVGGGYDDTYNDDSCELAGVCSRANNSTVFINGNLVVRGTTFITSKHYGGSSFVFKAIEHTGGQLEPAPHGDEWGDGFSQIPVLSSDRRLKYVGKESTDGLEKIKQLKVFNYTFKKDEKKTPRVGVMAQDLQKIFPNAVKKAADGFLTIRMEDMFYAVINAIKELDAKYQAQEKRIDELEKRIKVLENKIK